MPPRKAFTQKEFLRVVPVRPFICEGKILFSHKEATAANPELSALKEQTYIGWPSDIKGVPALIKPYWAFRDEISIDNRLIMKQHRIIIPKALQNEILLKLHASHQGTEKTKLRARSAFYWRDLNRDIDNVTKSCSICQELQSKQAKEPLMPTEIPPHPVHPVQSFHSTAIYN